MKRTSIVFVFFTVCVCLAGVAAAGSGPAAASPETLAFLSSLAAPEAPAAADLFAVGTPAPIALTHCGPDFCTQAQKDECDASCYPCNGRHTCNFQTCVFWCTCGFNCDF